MIEMGFIAGFGLLMLLVKLPWRWKLRLLSAPVITDAVIFTVLMVLHWGTFSGVMVATIGAFVCSLILSAARKLYGHIEDGSYIAGFFDVRSKL